MYTLVLYACLLSGTPKDANPCTYIGQTKRYDDYELCMKQGAELAYSFKDDKTVKVEKFACIDSKKIQLESDKEKINIDYR